jgi:hypothetical protein
MDRVTQPRRAAIMLVVAGLLVLTAGVSSARSAPSTGPYWAAVRSDGTVVAGSTGVSVGAHSVTGRYDLAFPQDVSRCAIVATSGIALDRGVIGEPSAGLETVVGGGFFSALNRVSVLETRNGTPTDFSFSIVAYC